MLTEELLPGSRQFGRDSRQVLLVDLRVDVPLEQIGNSHQRHRHTGFTDDVIDAATQRNQVHVGGFRRSDHFR